MENRKQTSRGLEKVYQYFLTSEALPSHPSEVGNEGKLEDATSTNGSDKINKLEKTQTVFNKGQVVISKKNILLENTRTMMKGHSLENSVSSHGHIYDNVEKTVAKLHVLKDSCNGRYGGNSPGNNLIWFQGAAAMLQEAVLNLTKVLYSLRDS